MVASTQSRRKVRFICVFALGAPVVAIGGVGTFDGVFLIGILAGLLAAWIALASRDPALAASH